MTVLYFCGEEIKDDVFFVAVVAVPATVLYPPSFKDHCTDVYQEMN